MLIEMEQFNEIYVNFLIVGHTHASIDQFFSVLKKASIEESQLCGQSTITSRTFHER